MNEPRNWKWAVPMMLMPVFGLLTYWMTKIDPIWILYLACVPGTVTLVMMLLTISNFVRYQAEWRADVFDRRQRALNQTPVAMMADALRGMHPEAVKVLNRFGVRTSWEIDVDTEAMSRDWTLLGTNVHFGFVEMVLDKSTGLSLYPKNRLSEGSKKWDPDGIMTDYEQYDEFQAWLVGRLIVTKAWGNQPSMFIPPWNPDALRKVMGLGGGELELWRPDEGQSPTINHPEYGGTRLLKDTLDDLIPLRLKD